MITYFEPSYLLAKFLNNLGLSLFLFAALGIAVFCAVGLVRREFPTPTAKGSALAWLLGLIGFSTLVYQGGITVGVLPDIAILLFAVWALIHMRQDVSPILWIIFALLGYFFFFSPERLDIQFDNRYVTVLKPFIYLIILYLFSATQVRFNFRPVVYGAIVAYPVLLVWHVLMWWYQHGFFLTRPNFIIENNFEIPPLLYCFIVIAFIYRDKDLRVFILLAVGVLLTGSRSGLVALMAVSIFYIASLGWKKMLWAAGAAICALAYIVYLRTSVAVPEAHAINPIDRIQTFLRIYTFYNNSFWEILQYPLGVGIYEKIPYAICNQFEEYADWFTGNYFNCDPLMLQSFVARALYQFGIYVLVFIPLAFYWELRRRMGWFLGFIALVPMLAASFSVGGFSNGLAFGSLLLCLLAYQQCRSSKPLTAC
jgi:hypothetical protein